MFKENIVLPETNEEGEEGQIKTLINHLVEVFKDLGSHSLPEAETTLNELKTKLDEYPDKEDIFYLESKKQYEDFQNRFEEIRDA